MLRFSRAMFFDHAVFSPSHDFWPCCVLAEPCFCKKPDKVFVSVFFSRLLSWIRGPKSSTTSSATVPTKPKKVLRMLHLFPFLFFFSFLSAHEPREYLEVRHLTQTTQTIATTPFLHAPREYPEVDSLPPVELRPRQGVAGNSINSINSINQFN